MKSAAKLNLSVSMALATWMTMKAESEMKRAAAQRRYDEAFRRLETAEADHNAEVRYWSGNVAAALRPWLARTLPAWGWELAPDSVIGHAFDAAEPGGQSIEVGIEPDDIRGFTWFVVSARRRVVHGVGESIREAMRAMLADLELPAADNDAWPDLAPLTVKLRTAVEALAVSSVDVGDASPAAATAARRRPRGPGGRFAPRDPAAPDGGGS